MKLLDGAKLAKIWEAELLATKPARVADLVGVLVGNDPASVLYLQLKEKMAKRLGIGFRLVSLPATTSKDKVRTLIEQLNTDPGVGGIIVQLPLPKKFKSAEVVNWVALEKDVDGLSDAAIKEQKVLPATAAGIVKLIEHYKIALRGKNIVLVGFSRLLNVPLSIFLANHAANVVVLQESTKDYSFLKRADIIISAVGRYKLIKAGQVTEGVVVIDAGIVKQGKKVTGDADFSNVSKKASMITPVPGGVGPMTLVGLLSNLILLQKAASSK